MLDLSNQIKSISKTQIFNDSLNKIFDLVVNDTITEIIEVAASLPSKELKSGDNSTKITQNKDDKFQESIKELLID